MNCKLNKHIFFLENISIYFFNLSTKSLKEKIPKFQEISKVLFLFKNSYFSYLKFMKNSFLKQINFRNHENPLKKSY